MKKLKKEEKAPKVQFVDSQSKEEAEKVSPPKETNVQVTIALKKKCLNKKYRQLLSCSISGA